MLKTNFNIKSPKKEIVPFLKEKIDNLTKPKGSLGRLEKLAVQIGTIQQTLSPSLNHPHHIVFGGDHGITAEGVSYSPPEVTPQMVFNFMEGGAGINFLARQHNIQMKIVDSGINYDFESSDQLIDLKVRKGTRNYLHEKAITREEFDLCIERGAQVVKECHNAGCNVISFGEMGIGNTSSSSLWMTCLTGIPLDQCVGAGSGFDSEGVKRKYSILKQALDNYKGDGSIIDILCYFGGYEMLMTVGAMLQAAELNMVILIDGFIMTNCILAASRLYPEVMEYSIFCHQGDEAGHRLVLDYLHARPLLNFGMRLGEGTGALCAYPLIDSSVRMINEMSSFKQASVTKYF
ncbi:MAG: nicotinate-nucleotide--dimethylbenzimidazole phosphoribosyltransferase [Bacteroidota bacterium]|nr:nicotinate-nucleotide--dimethylbenzimidazole phosphoribosyltransferase [Bacteroidota bacterium]